MLFERAEEVFHGMGTPNRIVGRGGRDDHAMIISVTAADDRRNARFVRRALPRRPWCRTMLRTLFRRMRMKVIKPFGRKLPDGLVRVSLCDRNPEVSQALASIFQDVEGIEVL